MILQFDMEITHVPSRDNVIADALSRQYERWKVDHWWHVNAQTATSVTSLIAEELYETRKMEIRMAEDQLLVKGDQVGEHIDRFSRKGKYHPLNVADYIVVDFRPGPVSNVRLYEKRLSVFFDSDFSACKYVFGNDKTVRDIRLCS